MNKEFEDAIPEVETYDSATTDKLSVKDGHLQSKELHYVDDKAEELKSNQNTLHILKDKGSPADFLKSDGTSTFLKRDESRPGIQIKSFV